MGETNNYKRVNRHSAEAQGSVDIQKMSKLIKKRKWDGNYQSINKSPEKLPEFTFRIPVLQEKIQRNK